MSAATQAATRAAISAAAGELMLSFESTARSLVDLIQAASARQSAALPAAEDLARLLAFRAAAGVDLVSGKPPRLAGASLLLQAPVCLVRQASRREGGAA